MTAIASPTWQGWYDPTVQWWQHPDHQQYFRYDIHDLPNPFYQEAGTIYWLEICPSVDWLWGWKSSEDHFEDDAVWRGEASGWEWIDLWEPPNFVQSLDLAFSISGECEPPPRPDPWEFHERGYCSGDPPGFQCRNDADCPPGQTCEDYFGGDCQQDSDCWGPAQTVAYCIPQEGGVYPGTCYAPATRYISIARNPSQVANTGRRIKLQGCGAGPWWVGAPQTYLDPTCLESLEVAEVVNAPVYAGIDFVGDWPDVVHVKCCEIAPNQTYLVQAIESGQDIDNEDCYSEALPLDTVPVWGDIVSTCAFNNCLPPQGDPLTQPNIGDVLASVNRFTGICNGPLVWFDIDPCFEDGCPEVFVGIGDVLAVVNAFVGQPYPGWGPYMCP